MHMTKSPQNATPATTKCPIHAKPHSHSKDIGYPYLLSAVAVARTPASEQVSNQVSEPPIRPVTASLKAEKTSGSWLISGLTIIEANEPFDVLNAPVFHRGSSYGIGYTPISKQVNPGKRPPLRPAV